MRHDGGMEEPPSGPRSVKISDDERGAWTSDRPRRDNRPPRPRDISVRSRILHPTDRMRYSPGSLVVLVSASAADRDRFAQRVLEDKSALFSMDKVRAVLAADGVDAGSREVFVRMAAAAERPRHLILLEIPRDQVPEEQRATLNELR